MREMKDSGVPWIGEIPKDWILQRGKSILTLLERPVKDDDGVITCFRDGEVTLRSNRREEGFTFSVQEIGYQGIEPGDLVVHGMDGFAGSIGISDSRGKATPVLNVMDSMQSKRYLMYQMRTMAQCGLFFALSSGIRVRTCDTNWNKLKILSYIIPSLTEQQRIADYLDTKCAEIESIIEKTRASIEEYKKLKQSVITEAVTKGIRENRPMKDSGVEWIGKIPAEWEYNRLKFLFTLHRGYDLANDLFAPGGRVPVYGSGGFMGYHNIVKAKGPNIIIGRSGSTGKLHYITQDFWPHNTGIYVSDFKGNNEKYVFYVLSALDMSAISTQTAVPTLDRKKIQESFLTFTTSIKEQQEIAAYLDEKCAAIDSLIASKEALITELETYKKSLIYEYVTGKKEVPESSHA